MKKTIALFSFLLTLFSVSAQNVYWVFLTDKAGTAFDPYTYFAAKAIERYRQCGADLYDVTNYPLQQRYVDGVDALATEEVGTSRWMNAIGVVATPDQVVAIEHLPYVLRVQPIESNMQLAGASGASGTSGISGASGNIDTLLNDQLIRMQGQLFREHGIDGHGVRIAVFDGGFPKVNTHEAFRHLREGKQIIKTWNFPNRKEDVYGWNSHGTMTLSCIAGRCGTQDLGLATGAEFLLARTEVEPEPFKEEIWWMQAVEWADRNGANIISSSLGYGKDRYYTKDMDGKSYVAKAGNLAARKGMLVVNSAGNEADDGRWQYIITPSDADSVLCIGGIENSLTEYNHISFSSFGPTADGRQKPNLCAFGYAKTASPNSNTAYNMVHGTSFSCPLVAGFAACAWQASKGKTNMEMFDLLQRSADLYPYCDYAFGYGVPQASFFVGPNSSSRSADPTFRFETVSPISVKVVFTKASENAHIFYKDIDENGKILFYGKRSVHNLDTTMHLNVKGGHRLVVFYDGYMADYRFERASNINSKSDWVVMNEADEYGQLTRATKLDIPNESRSGWETYFMLGLPVNTDMEELDHKFWSPAKHVGLRYTYNFTKAYSWGLALEYANCGFRFGDQANHLDTIVGMDDNVAWLDKNVAKHRVNFGEISFELFQRVRFVPGGMLHKGWHWDLGVYGSWGYTRYILKGSRNGDVAAARKEVVTNFEQLDTYRWNYGVTTRFTYDAIGIYARYRLNGIGQQVPAGKVLLPRLEVGVQLLL